MKRPRKRRTQTLAEKGQLAALYPWQEVLGMYSFNPHKDVSAVIVMTDSWRWEARVMIHGKRYVGVRSTLEDAFKACANLLYKHAKDFWLRMDTRAVTAPWVDKLPEVENVR